MHSTHCRHIALFFPLPLSLSAIHNIQVIFIFVVVHPNQLLFILISVRVHASGWCRQCSALNCATNPNYPDTEPRMSRIKTRTRPSVSGSTAAKTHFSDQNKQVNPLSQKLDRP